MTAIELLKQDIDSEIKSGTKMVVNWDMYLEMEKQQIIDALEYGWDNGHIHISILEDVEEKYYTSTYGSKGSDDTNVEEVPNPFLEGYEQINQNNPVTRGSTALVPISSQTEIYDEEIEEASAKLYTTPHGSWGFVQGAKWYREQLKTKQ